MDLENKTDKQKQNMGFTLVELMVCFALLGIFMVAAARIISYTVTVYHAAKATDHGLQVASEISDQVSGVVSGMRDDIDISIGDLHGSSDTTKLPCTKDNKFYMVDYTGCPVAIFKNDNGYLEIDYYNQEADKSYTCVPWYFDKKAYLGFTITDMNLGKAGSEYPDNVYRLDVTLHSGQFGDYKNTRYIRCMEGTP